MAGVVFADVGCGLAVDECAGFEEGCDRVFGLIGGACEDEIGHVIGVGGLQ